MSHDLRRKLQQKGDTLTQDVPIKTAASNEAAQAKLASMESKNLNASQIRDSSKNCNHHHKGKKTSGE